MIEEQKLMPNGSEVEVKSRRPLYFGMIFSVLILLGLGARRARTGILESDPRNSQALSYRIVGEAEIDHTPTVSVSGSQLYQHFTYTSQNIVPTNGGHLYMKTSNQRLFYGDCELELISFSDVYHENVAWDEIVLTSTRDSKYRLEEVAENKFEDELMSVMYTIELSNQPDGPWTRVEFKRWFRVKYDVAKIRKVARKH